MPNRSANRPTMMPPIMKPMVVSVYVRDASARCTLKSACTAGSVTTRDHRPTQPSVLRVIETMRRIQEYEVSIDGSSGGTTMGSPKLVVQVSQRHLWPAFASDKAGFLFCRMRETHAPC